MSDSGLIFKIVDRRQWESAKAAGRFAGAAIDLEDGYIHFSAAHQVAETARRHFADQDDLLLVAVAAEGLGPDLKWEVSRGGDRFPHLYRELRTAEVAWEQALTRGPAGDFVFPDALRSSGQTPSE